MTIDDLFLQFDEKITLDGKQVERMEGAEHAISEFLCKIFSLPESSVFLQGSYPNGTAVEPLEGGEYDVDLVCVTAEGSESADGALSALTRAFESDGRFKDRIHPKTPCVRLEYAPDEVGKFHVDVVPARLGQEDAPLDVPRKNDGWHGTAPQEYTNWCAQNGPEFRRTVKALKRWRDENQTVRGAIKSIVLQVLVAEHMPIIPSESERLAETIRSLSRNLVHLNEPPEVFNPVLSDENLARRWAKAAFNEFQQELKEAEEHVDAALQIARSDVHAASQIWQELFGDDFPVPQANQLGFQVGDASHAHTIESKGWTRSINPGSSIAVHADQQFGKRSPRRKTVTDETLVFVGKKLHFKAVTDVPTGAEIWWQVVNTGAHARDSNGLRGEIFKGRDLKKRELSDETQNWEGTSFMGSHLIRALAVVNNVVAAESDYRQINIYAKGRQFRL